MGIGALDITRQHTIEDAQKFYTKIAAVGLENGVSVSVTRYLHMVIRILFIVESHYNKQHSRDASEFTGTR